MTLSMKFAFISWIDFRRRKKNTIVNDKKKNEIRHKIGETKMTHQTARFHGDFFFFLTKYAIHLFINLCNTMSSFMCKCAQWHVFTWWLAMYHRVIWINSNFSLDEQVYQGFFSTISSIKMNSNDSMPIMMWISSSYWIAIKYCFGNNRMHISKLGWKLSNYFL